jgi:hypothetical protein
MTKRTAGLLIEPIPGYEGLSQGRVSLFDFPSVTSQSTFAQRAPRWPAAVSARPTAQRAATAADVQNALYMGGLSCGLIVGTTLGLSILGALGG